MIFFPKNILLRFKKRYDFISDDCPQFSTDVNVTKRLDMDLKASGSANDEEDQELDNVW